MNIQSKPLLPVVGVVYVVVVVGYGVVVGYVCGVVVVVGYGVVVGYVCGVVNVVVVVGYVG